MIEIDNKPVETLRRKNRALLFYLASQSRPVTRDQILALFWPDVSRTGGQQDLRTGLHDLRKHLENRMLVVENDRLSLDPTVQVDARLFETGIKDASLGPDALSVLLKLYRGEFLEGLTLPDTPAFDDWASGEREHYRTLAIRGYAALARLYEAQADYTAALEALIQGLAFDPLQEEMQRDALRLHYLSGDRAGAIRRYEALRRLLSEEMGLPPMPETRELYDAIISDTLPTRQAHQHHKVERSGGIVNRQMEPLVPFTGRTAELELLNTLSQSQKMVLIEGEPGIGKTRLITEFLAVQRQHARSGGKPAFLLQSASHEAEQGLPYQPVVDALRSLMRQSDWPSVRASLDIDPVWLAEILRLLPELQKQMPDLTLPAQPADEAHLWEAVHQFLLGLSAQRQVILFLDDLHWADPSTLGLTGYLARRLASPAFLLIGTARPVDHHTRLGRLQSDLTYGNNLAVIRLSPLGEADTMAIAGKISPAIQKTFSLWLLDNAEGNPFFLNELVRHALTLQGGSANGTIDLATITSQTLPPTIQNLILSRLVRLSEGARHLLDVAAVIGREFDVELLYRSINISGAQASEERLLDDLDELQTTGLIQPHGEERYYFDHSLTMEVVLKEMGPARERRLHRQVAQAMEQLGIKDQPAAAGTIARQYAQSNNAEAAAPFAYQAGRYAAGLGAWDEAIAFYEQGLQVSSDDMLQVTLLLGLGDALFHKGDFPQASQIFKTAVDRAKACSDMDHIEDAYLELNKSLLPQSRYSEAIALGRDLALSGPPELAICAQFIWGAGLSVESAHPVEAEAHLRVAERLLAERPGYAGPVSKALIHYQLAAVIGQQGKRIEAVALYRKALALVEADGDSLDLLRQIMLYNNLAYHLYLLGDPGAAKFAEDGLILAQQRGSLTHLPYLLSTSGEIALGQGALDAAEDYFKRGLELAEQVPVPERIAGLTANLGLVAHRRGQDELARRRLRDALSRADELGVLHLAARIRSWLAPLVEPQEAERLLDEARRIAEENGFGNLTGEMNHPGENGKPGGR